MCPGKDILHIATFRRTYRHKSKSRGRLSLDHCDTQRKADGNQKEINEN